MSAAGLVDPISDVPDDIRFVIVADAQITVPDLRAVQQTYIEIISREPALFRLRVTV